MFDKKEIGFSYRSLCKNKFHYHTWFNFHYRRQCD